MTEKFDTVTYLKELEVKKISSRASSDKYQVMVSHPITVIAFVIGFAAAIGSTWIHASNRPGDTVGATLAFLLTFGVVGGIIYFVLFLIISHQFFTWGRDTERRTFYEPSPQYREIPIPTSDQTLLMPRPSKTLTHDGYSFKLSGTQLDAIQRAIRDGDISIRRDKSPGRFSFQEIGIEGTDYTTVRFLLIELGYVVKATGNWTIKGVLWVCS